jgi:hypothetical protein
LEQHVDDWLWEGGRLRDGAGVLMQDLWWRLLLMFSTFLSLPGQSRKITDLVFLGVAKVKADENVI